MTVKEEEASEKAMSQLILFYMYVGGEADTARSYARKAAKTYPSSVDILLRRAWNDLLHPPPDQAASTVIAPVLDDFDSILGTQDGKSNLEALLGKAYYLAAKSYPNEALEVYNKVISAHPWFLPAFTEKAKVLVAAGDWAQAIDNARRLLTHSNQDVEAHRLIVLHALSHDSRREEAAGAVNALSTVLQESESSNFHLHLSCAKLVSRLSSRFPALLKAAMALAQKAVSLNPSSAHAVTEVGYIQLLQGSYSEAASSFKAAIKLDEGDMDALNGTIRCQIESGQLDEAEQQLEFLSALQSTLGKTPGIAFLSAQLAWAKKTPPTEVLTTLEETLKLHLRLVKNLPIGINYYITFNPDFMMELVSAYLTIAAATESDVNKVPSPGVSSEATTSPALATAIRVLEIITAQVPGSLNAFYLLARAKFLAGSTQAALKTLNTVTTADPGFADALLLAAELHVSKGDGAAASQALNQALAQSFAIKSKPAYALVRARASAASGDREAAEKDLLAAMALDGVRSAAPGTSTMPPLIQSFTSTADAGPKGSIRLDDRVSVFLELANVQNSLGKTAEAAEVLKSANTEFQNTPAAGKVALAQARLLLSQGETDSAMALLAAIKPGSSHYELAQMAVADVALKYKHDRREYLRIHKDLTLTRPSSASFLGLGNAYMKMSQPEEAIAAFEQALVLDPKNTQLASHIGKAHILTHNYERALAYYETAVRNDPDKFFLRYDLAELNTRLRRYEAAEEVIQASLTAISADNGKSRSARAANVVKMLLLMARVHEGNNNITRAIESLERAIAQQMIIIDKLKPDRSGSQATIAADIYSELARLTSATQGEKAIGYYKEALQVVPTHKTALLGLAKLHLARKEFENCRSRATALLRVDPGNEEASIMLADFMFQRNEQDAAMFHFSALLEKNPGHFAGLVRLIELMWRAGRLKEIPRFLRMAEGLSARAASDPGLHYARGLYARLSQKPREALHSFNLCRNDTEWGAAAKMAMIETYLNPDNETLWATQPGANDPKVTTASTSKLNAEQGEDAAERASAVSALLAELPETMRTPRQQVLATYAKMSSKTKPDIEASISEFAMRLKDTPDYIPALVGLATAHQLLKQTPKARNHLKRLAKLPYNSEFADDFERGWLLLADIYIGSSKYDLAEELLKKALKYNASCSKAHELMGLVKEKELSYRDAASHYESAWSFANESSAPIGFRLAFNYLKAHRYVDAIDVCHTVLRQWPGYPKIQKDIMDKARASLRT